MSPVQTVTGDIPPEQLDIILPHEHLAYGLPGWQLDPMRPEPDYDGMRRALVAQLTELRQLGVTALVDMTTMAATRDPVFQQEVAAASGLPVIGVTGFSQAWTCPGYFSTMSVEQLTDVFVRELTSGMAKTSIKAGLIKIGTSLGGITESEQKVIRAAARAQKATGSGISSHTTGGAFGPEMLDILEEEGADFSKVVVGHCDENPGPDYHLGLVRRGACVQLDKVGINGRPNIMTDQRRVEVIRTLVDAGFAPQVLISQDIVTFFYDREIPAGSRRSYSYLLQQFVPMLLQAGLPESDVRTIIVDNPKRLLGIS